jgi:methyl-accepting chemotaxis protein
MARYTANSLLNSLKGKIWLATSAMAFVVCTFGLISYLVVSFVIEDTFYAVFVPFLLLAFGIMVFGWWLSNEVISPIEKVSLLAKSLERSATTSLPKTTGSSETDELLQTLHRNSRQIQNLISMMDEVTEGNTQIAITPLQNSDRLSSSFQKLLAKISDSIDAKRELENLQAAVLQISEEISRVRKGNLDIEIKADFKETKEISETLKFLLNHLSSLVLQVRNDSELSRISAAEIRKIVQNVIQQKEFRVQELNRAAATLVEIPSSVQKISEHLSKAVATGNQSIETARKGAQTAQENRDALGSLRKQIQESVSRVGRLNERSKEISKIAKTVEDLAHRTNMIALNASIQAGETGEKGGGFSIIAEEIEQLAARADNTNKQISSLNKSISVEIGEVERTLTSTTQEFADLSKFALETGNALSELEKYLTQFLNLQGQLTNDSREQSAQTEKAYQTFIASVSETEKLVAELKKSENLVTGFTNTIESLQMSAAIFKLAELSSKEPVWNESLSNFSIANSEPKTELETIENFEEVESLEAV